MKKILLISASMAMLMINSCGKDNPQGEDECGTGDATEITETSVTLWGYAKTRSYIKGTIGIIYSTNPEPSTGNGKWLTITEFEDGNTYKVAVAGLQPQTTYYYKAYIKDYERECSGIVKSFTTKEPLESIPDYIENSVNYGHGVLIDEVVGGKAVKLYWAPVNCGQVAPDGTSTKGQGMLYIWGFGDSSLYGGLGMAGLWTNTASLPIRFKVGEKVPTESRWYGEDIIIGSTSDTWNGGRGPCPEGWRLPTRDELAGLIANRSAWIRSSIGASGWREYGFWLNGSNPAAENIGIFVPASGTIGYSSSGAVQYLCFNRGDNGFYWSSNPCSKNEAFIMAFNGVAIDTHDTFRYNGNSVRCVRDAIRQE